MTAEATSPASRTATPTGRTMPTVADDPSDATELRRLAFLQVCDSVFPVGAFALSNGMETFVQRDFVRTDGDFEEYLHEYLEVAAYREVGHMVLAGRLAAASRADDADFRRRLADLDDLVAALQSPREIREGQHRMCTRLITLADQMEATPLRPADSRAAAAHGGTRRRGKRPHEAPPSAPVPSASPRGIPHLDAYAELIDTGRCLGLHAIAMGLFAADRAPDLREAAVTYCYSLLSALVVCAVKAVPISQVAGQAALRDGFPDVVAAVDLAFTLEPDDLGVSGAYLDIAAMQHETLYSRLYMS